MEGCILEIFPEEFSSCKNATAMRKPTCAFCKINETDHTKKTEKKWKMACKKIKKLNKTIIQTKLTYKDAILVSCTNIFFNKTLLFSLICVRENKCPFYCTDFQSELIFRYANRTHFFMHVVWRKNL